MKSISFSLLILVLVLFSWQCTEKYPASGGSVISSADGCVACHTNADLLKEVATPLPPPGGDAGEG